MGTHVIVADANLLIYHFVQGAKTELAHQVSERDADWIVPSLWRHEFLNALCMNVRGAGMPAESALAAYNDAELLLAPREHTANPADVIRLSIQHGISGYDAQYVALAMSLHLRLVTEDKELILKLPGTALSMNSFLALPSGRGGVRESSATYRTSRGRPKQASHARA
jgi:predicted nucleic acid-binding protein